MKIKSTLIAVFLFQFIVCNWVEAQSWNLLPNPDGLDQETEDVFFVSADTGFVAGWRNLNISKTTDGGQTWTATGFATNCSKAVFFIDSQNGYATGCNHSIAKTTNGGNSWNVTTATNLNTGMGLFFINKDTGFVVSNVGIIFRTIDQGQNWVNIYDSSSFSSSFNDIFFPSSETGYVIGVSGFYPTDSAVILKTVDKGSSWLDISPDIAGLTLQAVWFINNDTGFAVGSKYILKTTNGGTSWTQQSDINWYLQDIAFINPQVGYAIGNNIILKTIDGGISWVTDMTSVGNLTGICFKDSVGYISTYSSNIYKYDLATSIKNHITLEKHTINISPNPAKDFIKIDVPNLNNKMYNLRIYDVIGNIVFEKSLQNNSKRIDISGLSKGIYTIKVSSEQGSATTKLIKE